MASNWYLCPLVCDVIAMSIEADVEGVLCLSNTLLSALPAVIQVDHVPCLAGGRSSYVECLVSGCTSKNGAGLDMAAGEAASGVAQLVWLLCTSFFRGSRISYDYRRPGFNCVVKQLRFWLFKVDCEFKDCDLRVLRIGHTCIIYTSCSNNCELREKSQFAIFKLRN